MARVRTASVTEEELSELTDNDLKERLRRKGIDVNSNINVSYDYENRVFHYYQAQHAKRDHKV